MQQLSAVCHVIDSYIKHVGSAALRLEFYLQCTARKVFWYDGARRQHACCALSRNQINNLQQCLFGEIMSWLIKLIYRVCCEQVNVPSTVHTPPFLHFVPSQTSCLGLICKIKMDIMTPPKREANRFRSRQLPSGFLPWPQSRPYLVWSRPWLTAQTQVWGWHSAGRGRRGSDSRGRDTRPWRQTHKASWNGIQTHKMNTCDTNAHAGAEVDELSATKDLNRFVK